METIELSSADLEGKALDWAVADLEFSLMTQQGQHVKDWVLEQHKAGERITPYSTEWHWAGPIIERERIATDGDEGPWNASTKDMPSFTSGDTLIQAAMRAYVCLKMGATATVPAHLATTDASQNLN